MSRDQSRALAIPVSSSMVMKTALPLPGRWRISTTPATRSLRPSGALLASAQLVTPSPSRMPRKNCMGWPFRERRVVW
jgi:hypothetical protein